jgi:hypothetical protein
MKSLLRSVLFGGVIAALFATIAAPAETKVEGVLIDKACSYKAETRVVPGPSLAGGIVVAYGHTRQCALMPECQRSGYGVFSYDNKFLAFDEAGNRKALAIFKESKKEDDFRVEVTGEVQGDVMKVSTIKLLN